MGSGKVVLQLPRTRILFSSIRGLLSSKNTHVVFPSAIMDTFQPVVAFNGLEMNISSAKALIEQYDRELSEVEALITRVEDDKREDERVLRARLQLQIDDLRAQESVEVEQLEVTSQARRAPLDEKRKSILAKIDGVKDSIAPIRNVPDEILGSIFREVVALHVAPWLLTTVNKSWRRTAMTNPWLWSNIDVGRVDEHRIPSDGQSEWLVDGISRSCCGDGVACRSLGELAYFVDKSGVVPLDAWVYPKVNGDEWGVLRRLLGPPLSSRIGSLSMYLTTHPPEVATGWILGPLPLLQNLSYGSSRGPLVELIMAQAHQLKDLTTHNLLSNPPKYPFWEMLRTINLGSWGDANELNQVISELRLIEVIEGSPKRWPDIETPVVTLEHIKSISLSCRFQHLARLRLPQLAKLIWSQYKLDLYSYYSFERLDFLTDPDWGLSFPNLGKIEACAVGKVFALALRELPNVHTALLTPKQSEDSEDLWVMDLIESLAAVEDMLCPTLRRLTIKELKSDKSLTEPLISRLLISRNALGIPFKHFQIVWAGFREVVQYTSA